jgi:cytochrome b
MSTKVQTEPLEYGKRAGSAGDSAQIYVWDRFVQTFHWMLVASFTVAFVTEDDLLGLHVWAGYIVGILVVSRILWGFVGPHYARFSDFVTRPRVALAYIIDLLMLRAERHLGHSPGGGAMVVLLLASLLLTVATGMAVYGAEEQAGPLAGWFAGTGRGLDKAMAEMHEFFANLTLALVFVHICGVILASFVQYENLVRSMITGFKRRRG